jgi:hypothetical protein
MVHIIISTALSKKISKKCFEKNLEEYEWYTKRIFNTKKAIKDKWRSNQSYE